MEIDHFDRRILALIQADNRMPQRDIAERVHLSASAVNRRIAAMEEAGVIIAHTAVVDPAAVGRPITIITEVSVESERADLLDAAKARFTAAPEVQQVYYVTGEGDFVLIITVPDMKAYEQLTRRLFFAEGNIKRFRTMVVMDRCKATLTAPTG